MTNAIDRATLKMIKATLDTIKERLYSKTNLSLSNTTGIIKQGIQTAREIGLENHAQLLNIGLYINLSAHDLAVLLHQLHIERDIWAQKLAARHAILLIFESVEDLTQLLGKNIRCLLNQIGSIDIFDAKLRNVKKPLDTFWKTYSARLKEVRGNAIAHRNHDGLTILESIESIDIKDIIRIGNEYRIILIEIRTTLLDILEFVYQKELERLHSIVSNTLQEIDT